jgi:hypothetical protein
VKNLNLIYNRIQSEHELLRRARFTLYAGQLDPDHTTAKSKAKEG